MAAKYYAVKVGKTPGVYLTWDECKKMVHGFPGAVYKSFPTREEAEVFAGVKPVTSEVNSGMVQRPAGADEPGEATGSGAYAFVDGSFNAATGVYGYGGFLVDGGERLYLKGNGADPEMASMRNVAGEVLGSTAAIREAVSRGIPELTIYYDYMGIEMWATGAWKRNKSGTIAYHDYVASVKDNIRLRFVKVKGHSGVEGNEEADRLAKEAVGIGVI